MGGCVAGVSGVGVNAKQRRKFKRKWAKLRARGTAELADSVFRDPRWRKLMSDPVLAARWIALHQPRLTLIEGGREE